MSFIRVSRFVVSQLSAALLVLPLAGACASDPDGASSSSGGASSSSGGTPPGDAGTTTEPDAAATCNASNCTGCCLNGTCQGGLTTAGCGRGGEACNVCVGKQVCKADQSCGIAPESLWKVQPKSATLTTKNGAADWDVGGGAPDPFVNLWCPPAAAAPVRTPTASDTFAPAWTTGGCVVKAKDLMALGFAVQVMDEDIAASDPVGAKLTVLPTEADLLRGNLTATSGPLTALRIDLVAQ